MKVLVTGATGFIGSHVVRCLVADGLEVHALIRPGSDTWRINDVIRSVTVIPCDLFFTGELDRFLKQIRPDLCIHLAWYVEPGKYLNSLENFHFMSASMQLATQLASLGCKRFLGVGTCFEYDTDLGYLSEGNPTLPYSPYAASKLGLYLALDQLGKVTGMEVAWLRLFYLYGPYEDRRRLVPSVICLLLANQVAKVTKGDQVRDFLHVEDVASAIRAVAKSKISGSVNIGSGKPVTVREIVNKIATILKCSELIALGAFPQKVSDPMFICANNRLLTEGTGWAPQYDLEGGLSHTVEWWKRQFERSQGVVY